MTVPAPDGALLRETTRYELIALLDSVSGRKTLALQPALAALLDLVADRALLKEHGVEDIVYLSEKDPLSHDGHAVVYLCRPEQAVMQLLARHVHERARVVARPGRGAAAAAAAAGLRVVGVVPRFTEACKATLTELGVIRDLAVHELHMDLFRMEADCWSMERPDFFQRLYVDEDVGGLFDVAQALVKIQTIYGLVPKILYKGLFAREVAQRVVKMSRSLQKPYDDPLSGNAHFPLDSAFDSMIILDRSVDMVTPLVTQLTYEGLLDAHYGIHCGAIKVHGLDPPSGSAAARPAPPPRPPATSGSAGPSPGTTPAHGGYRTSQAAMLPKPKHVPLNADDRLYGQLRDMNFTAVAHVLNQIAKRIQENYDKRHAAKTVSELKAFVGTLGGLQAQSQSLTVHTHLAEQVMRRTTSVAFQRALEQQQHLLSGIHIDDVMLFVHELIGRQAPLDQVLRFLCLVSLVDHSIRPKAYEQLHHRIVLAYGYQHIVTLRALWRVGLFRSTDALPFVATTYNAYSRFGDTVTAHVGAAADAEASVGPPTTIQDLLAAPRRSPVPVGDRPQFKELRRRFALIVDEVDEANPADISYVFSGYAPLSIRLVQAAFTATPPKADPAGGLLGAAAAEGSVVAAAAGMAVGVVGAAATGVNNLVSGVSGGGSSARPRFVGQCAVPHIAAAEDAAAATAGSHGDAAADGREGAAAASDSTAAARRSQSRLSDVADPSWDACRDDVDLAPGPKCGELAQACPGLELTQSCARPKRTLVVFVGGATWTELSALRLLNTQERMMAASPARLGGLAAVLQPEIVRQFTAVTTGMINSETMLRAFMPPSERGGLGEHGHP